MQYYLHASLREGLLAGLLLLFATSWLEATPLATLAPDTIIERDDYKVIIESSKDQTDVTLVDYNEQDVYKRQAVLFTILLIAEVSIMVKAIKHGPESHLNDVEQLFSKRESK